MGSCKYMSKSQKWLHTGIFILSIFIAMDNVECKDFTFSPKFLVNDNKIYEMLDKANSYTFSLQDINEGREVSHREYFANIDALLELFVIYCKLGKKELALKLVNIVLSLNDIVEVSIFKGYALKDKYKTLGKICKELYHIIFQKIQI